MIQHEATDGSGILVTNRSLYEDVRQLAAENSQRAEERRATDKSLKPKKGACEPAREHLRRSRKQRMRTVEHYLCDACDTPIAQPTDGFVVQGNIYVADPSSLGGLIGDNFPDSDEPFERDRVTQTVMCRRCFMKALGLFETKEKRRANWS